MSKFSTMLHSYCSLEITVTLAIIILVDNSIFSPWMIDASEVHLLNAWPQRKTPQFRKTLPVAG